MSIKSIVFQVRELGKKEGGEWGVKENGREHKERVLDPYQFQVCNVVRMWGCDSIKMYMDSLGEVSVSEDTVRKLMALAMESFTEENLEQGLDLQKENYSFEPFKALKIFATVKECGLVITGEIGTGRSQNMETTRVRGESKEAKGSEPELLAKREKLKLANNFFAKDPDTGLFITESAKEGKYKPFYHGMLEAVGRLASLRQKQGTFKSIQAVYKEFTV